MADLEVRDLTPAFGAEIIGFDPKAPLDGDTRKQLQDLFDQREVLVFRDIDLTHEQQVRLCNMLIRKDGAKVAENMPEDTWYISNERPEAAAPYGRLQFHVDSMWADEPIEVLSLYGSKVEQPAASTTFVSSTHAWETLPDDLRKRIEGLEVSNTNGIVRRGDLTDALLTEVENPITTVSKLARPHPRTGRMMLYACEQMTKDIVGLPHEESEALLGQVFDHMYDPSMQWDHEWRERDFVVWDNIGTQHCRKANVLKEGPARTLRKVGTPLPRMRPEQLPVYVG